MKLATTQQLLLQVAGALILLTHQHFVVGLKRSSPDCERDKRGIMYYKTRGGMERCRKKDCGMLPRADEHQNCYCCRLKDPAPAPHVATSSLSSTTTIALIVSGAVVLAIVGAVAIFLLKQRRSLIEPGVENGHLIPNEEPDSPPPIEQNGTEGDARTVAIPGAVVNYDNVRVMQGRGPSQSEAGLHDQGDDQDCNVDDDDDEAFQCETVKPEEDHKSCSDAPYVLPTTFHRDSKLATDFEVETPL